MRSLGYKKAVKTPQTIRDARRFCSFMTSAVGGSVIGQRAALEHLLTAAAAGGHCLVVGAPGLGKTTLARTFARCMSLRFRRIQCTPDLMPNDITGSEVFATGRADRHLRFIEGPVFAGLLLVDEINRAPPRTQAALLEAMREGFVTVGRRRVPLPRPFLVLATQNPLEHEGTYPLPEALLDRFLFRVDLDYPSLEEEADLLRGERVSSATEVLDATHLEQLQRSVAGVPAAQRVHRLATAIVRRSRPDDPTAPQSVRRHVLTGAGPQATAALLHAAKARALIRGQPLVRTRDVRAVAPLVLAHRLRLTGGSERDKRGSKIATRLAQETDVSAPRPDSRSRAER